MLLRIIIIMVILYNYKKILNFFNLEKLSDIKKNFSKITNKIENYDINVLLQEIKNSNKFIYKNIKKRIKLIEKIIKKVQEIEKITKGEYNIIKNEGKNMLNFITSLPQNENKEKYLLTIKEYIDLSLEKILKFRKNDIFWFEKDGSIEAYDKYINYNYDIY